MVKIPGQLSDFDRSYNLKSIPLPIKTRPINTQVLITEITPHACFGQVYEYNEFTVTVRTVGIFTNTQHHDKPQNSRHFFPSEWTLF